MNTDLPDQPSGTGTRQQPPGGRKLRHAVLLFLLLLGCLVLFTALGLWQLQRMAWKRDLIATVDARVHADAVSIPLSEDWQDLDVDAMVYRRVFLSGEYEHEAELQALAVTELGGGYWAMTPLRLEDGSTVLINRGFVPQDLRDPLSRQATMREGEVRVTGLIRATEPKGGFLRSNDPEGGRWYSRDTVAMAQQLQLDEPVAPFFVDAQIESPVQSELASTVPGATQAGEKPGADYPRAGMTVVNFRDTHLSYALTWFSLALLSIVGLFLLLRDWRSRAVSGGKALLQD